MSIERILRYGLVLVLLLAPLRFGSVEPAVSRALVTACFALGLLWVAWRSRRRLPALPWKDPVLIAGALFALVGVVQSVPVPRQVLLAVSPKAIDLRDRFEPAADDTLSMGREPAKGGDWRPVSLYPWATRQSTLRFLAFLLAGLITIDLAAVAPARRTLVGALAVSGGFQAVYGLAEYFSDRQQIFGYVKKWYTDVATGTFINRNHFAGYLEMTLPLAIALLAAALARLGSGRGTSLGQRLAGDSGQNLLAAGTLLTLCLTMATALVCSRSRMGIASMIFALLVTGALLAWRGRGRSFGVAAIGVAGVTLLLFSQGGAGAPIVSRFLVAAGEFQGSVGRWDMWSQAGGMLKAFPIVGVGLGVFGHVFSAFRTGGPGVFLDHAHNDYLELAAEIGLAGVLVALLCVVIVIASLLRQLPGHPDYGPLGYAAAAGVLALGFHSITDFNLAIPSNALTFSVVVGLVVRGRRAPTPALAAAAGPPPRRAWKVLAPAALLIAAAVCGWVDRDRADRYFTTGAVMGKSALDDLQGLVQAEAAGSVTSPEAVNYVDRRLVEAAQLQVLGLRSLPVSPEGHLTLGRFEVARCAVESRPGEAAGGCLARALPELQAALALSPMSASIHAQVAQILIVGWPILAEPERPAATVIIERAVSMNPGDQGLKRAWLEIGARTQG